MASKDEYVFTRDFLDNNRINLMHHLWTKTFGYNIHPNIPTEAANLRVADVGTGTGIWLLDINEKLQDAQLDGFDISFDAAPPRETLPPNVSFRHWNVKDSVPEDLVGNYDIVNVRFFSFVILNEEVPHVVSRLFGLLKPGGYLQWGEPDMESLRIDKTKIGCRTECLSELYKVLAVQDPRLQPSWVRNLPQIFEDSGLVAVERDIKDAPPHLAFIFHEAGLMIHEQIARKTQNEHLGREVKRLLPGAVEETRQGAYSTALRHTVIGRKP